MKTFKTYLQEDVSVERNLHIEHIDDLPLTEGQDGLKKVLALFKSIISQLAGISGKAVQVKTKYDGCVHPNTVLRTKEKDMSIGEMIMSSESNFSVLTHNFNTGNDEYQKAISPRVNNNGKDWVRVELENGEIVLTTEDHEFYVNKKGWVKAKDLTELDDILEIKATKI